MGIILMLAAGVVVTIAIVNANKHDDKTSKSGHYSSSQTLNPRPACSIFTLADAKQILGANAAGGDTAANGSSDDLAVSSCTYTQSLGGNGSVSSTKTATLLIRAPKSDSGRTSNQNQFDALRPTNTTPVSGYGQSAYWDPQLGQLNILKNDTWYILSNGSLSPSARTLDEAKQLADLLIDKM